MADVDIEHDRVTVDLLLLDQIVEVRSNRLEGFWQRLPFFHRVDSEIDGRETGVAETIYYIGLHQPAVGRQVDEDVFHRAVVDDLVNELRPQQRFATHQRQHARADRVQPVDRTLRHVFGHSRYLVVV